MRRKLYRVNQAQAPAKVYVTRMLTRDLFTVVVRHFSERDRTKNCDSGKTVFDLAPVRAETFDYFNNRNRRQ